MLKLLIRASFIMEAAAFVPRISALPGISIQPPCQTRNSKTRLGLGPPDATQLTHTINMLPHIKHIISPWSNVDTTGWPGITDVLEEVAKRNVKPRCPTKSFPGFYVNVVVKNGTEEKISVLEESLTREVPDFLSSKSGLFVLLEPEIVSKTYVVTRVTVKAFEESTWTREILESEEKQKILLIEVGMHCKDILAKEGIDADVMVFNKNDEARMLSLYYKALKCKTIQEC